MDNQAQLLYLVLIELKKEIAKESDRLLKDFKLIATASPAPLTGDEAQTDGISLVTMSEAYLNLAKCSDILDGKSLIKNNTFIQKVIIERSCDDSFKDKTVFAAIQLLMD